VGRRGFSHVTLCERETSGRSWSLFGKAKNVISKPDHYTPLLKGANRVVYYRTKLDEVGVEVVVTRYKYLATCRSPGLAGQVK
jgi:hypothetical protein